MSVIQKVLLGVVSFVLFIGLMESFTVVPPGHVGVLFNSWSGKLEAKPQGMAFTIPFVTTVQKYPVALRTYTLVQKNDEGSSKDDDSIDLPTREGQHIKQDISVTYNTSDNQAANVFKSFNGADISDIESTFIRRTVITVAQNVAGAMSLTELISSSRDKFQSSIQDALSVELEKMGFKLDKVNLGASHLPPAIEAQMQAKMGAQQNAQQAEYELQKQTILAKAKVAQAEGDAKATLLNARAQAEANELTLKGLTPSLIEYERVKKWDGKMPQVSLGNGGGVLLNLNHSAGK